MASKTPITDKTGLLKPKDRARLREMGRGQSFSPSERKRILGVKRKQDEQAGIQRREA